METASDDDSVGSRVGGRLAAATLVTVAISPIVVGMAALAGERWMPTGDHASTVFRVSQVGGWATPLVGQESVKGFAHPGPLLFWLSAPLHALTGGDPRAVLWTGGVLNALALAGVGIVAWRRGRWPLLLGSMLVVALLVRSFEPERLVSLWVPFLPFCAFVLALFLAWDVALGNRRSIVWFVVAAGFAGSTHLSYTPLVGLLAVWLVAWSLLWPRLLPAEPPGSLPAPPWQPWLATTWRAGLLLAVPLAGPFLDLLVDTHNAVRIVGTQLTPPASVGLMDAIGIVGRNARPDGPWINAAQRVTEPEVHGSGPVPLLVALVLLVGCVVVARRHRLVDAAALSTLALTLVVGSVLATTRIYLPVASYLVQYQKIVGTLTWFAVAWTAWRLAEPTIRSGLVRRRAAGVAGCAAVIAVAAWTWGTAADLDLPDPKAGRAVLELRHQLGEQLSDDETIRVESAGDRWGTYGPGVIYVLIDGGYDVTTQNGDHGLKWGHEHRWDPGDDYDVFLTVAVDMPGGFDSYSQCQKDPTVEQVATHDQLRPDERAWLSEKALELVQAEPLSGSERARVERLLARDVRVGVFAGERACAEGLAADSGQEQGLG